MPTVTASALWTPREDLGHHRHPPCQQIAGKNLAMLAEKEVAGTPNGDNEHSGTEAQSPRHSSSSSATIESASEGPAMTTAGAQINEADETDRPIAPVSSVVIVPDEVYSRFTPRRKAIIVALLSFCAFLAPISSTSSLSATPEIAAEYDTTGSILNIASALYMLFMGLSPMFWGPLSEVFGRRIVRDLPDPSRVDVLQLTSDRLDNSHCRLWLFGVQHSDSLGTRNCVVLCVPHFHSHRRHSLRSDRPGRRKV